ncbi:hypothetical protein Trydic_g15257 [Trypoxylus dichotomus]
MVFAKALEDIGKYLEECTGKASVHGVQFIGDRKRSVLERVIWLGIWITSVVMCSKYVMQTYEKWESSPVFVTIGTGQMPIHDISFPAVTICPEAKTDIELFSYPAMMDLALSEEENLTETQKTQFEYMTMICNRTSKPISMESDYFDIDVLHFLSNVTPSFNETFISCKFSGEIKDCREIFTPVFTVDGVCYSFNILDHKEMFRETVQQFEDFMQAPKSVCFNQPYTNSCKNVYPQRASTSGSEAGLEVELGVLSENLDFKCASAMQGYKVILHDPSELPYQSHNHFRLPLDEAVFVSVIPEVLVTKPELKSYAAGQRKCFFEDEKVLERFRLYSQDNCEIECLVYLLNAGLDCIDFYLPHTNATKNVCGPGVLHFIRILEKLLFGFTSNTLDLNFTPEMNHIKGIIEKFGFLEDVLEHCECLPSCSSVKYSFETSQTDYFWRSFVDSGNFGSYRSLLNIHFKHAQYIPLERKEMFGAMDFIAYCGGLLGLFIGFSFISLIEVFYFLTLRIGCNVRMYGRKLWYGIED